MAAKPVRRPAADAPREATALLDTSRGPLEPPIRSEIFGAARFERHGHSLAETHEAEVRSWRAEPFFPRLHQNVRVLREAQHYIGAQASVGRLISPAGEWLLDNFHLVEAQLKEIHEGLPRRFFRDLPVLTNAHLSGLPRVYGVAWAFVAHTDSAFDVDLLEAFLGAYQEARQLSLAELWALPTTLRVVLIENLRRLAERVATAKAAREMADAISDRETPPTPQELDEMVVALDTRGSGLPFLMQLWQRTHDANSPRSAALHEWLSRQLPDPAGAQSQAQAEQAANNLSVGNAITALRLLGNADWRGLIGRVSPLMRMLDQLPVHHAEREDTQDDSLHAIEQLAHRSKRPETEVAQALIGLMPASHAQDAITSAPGYWLHGPGRGELYRKLGLRAPVLGLRGALASRVTLPAYLFALLAGSIAFTVYVLQAHPEQPVLLTALAALLLLFPCSETVVAVINRVISESIKPTRLPRLGLAEGIGPAHRTLVVMPCMLTSEHGVQALAVHLERHHLANPQRHAQFALLSDWADAQTLETGTDQALLAVAHQAIAALNAKHSAPEGEPARFLLLHRARQWSESEQRFIGWERKRGKLEQLMAEIVQPAGQLFIDLAEASAIAPGTRYVLTLDADTELPPGRLCELVGVAAHPLNTPRIDPAARRVVSGHAIFQPRVTTPLPDPGRVTPYHWLYAGQCGIDPYSVASSEVYQDLFDEGSFTGKGLIDVHAMHTVLGGRLPAERILSHDLLEGAIARCAGVSDVTVIEEAPAHADVAASRVHRWARGDWQLLPLLLNPKRFTLGAINRWKMADNLRRSLVAPASLLLLLLALTTDVVAPWAALALVAAAFCSGALIGAIAGLAPSRDSSALGYFYRHALVELSRTLAIGAWSVLQLLENAMLYADAIARAVYRMAVSRRHLLEWTTAAAAEAAATTSVKSVWQKHSRVSVTALVLLLLVLVSNGPAPLLGVALCLAWGLSPALTAWASRPRLTHEVVKLDASSRDYLAGVGRDTWRLFERCISAEDNYLPPDNLQTSPYPIIAHRTSPTNIGLYLLTSCCARQFGWIGTADLLTRLEQTLETIDKLPRYRGHLYNWIDTRTLEVLHPGYISSVDSGNFCAHLLAVSQACLQLAQHPLDEAPSRMALATSRRRLDPQLLPLQALGHNTLVDLVRLEDPVARTRGSSRSFNDRVNDASASLDELLSGLGSEDIGHDLRGGMLQQIQDHLNTLRSAARDHAADASASSFAKRLRAIAERCQRMAWEADFTFLFNPVRRLLHIGFRVPEQQLDSGYYDLLASEARLTSLLGIAKGDLPVAHWGALGRPFYALGSVAALKSWSGSMFEYLMPSLVLDEPHGSVLQQATHAAVTEQIDFGAKSGLPWGISESAYAASDHTLAYQYAPQGVPRLALRRTPNDERVIAPYATLLATQIAPRRAEKNLRALEAAGARDEYGFIEALDYTPERLTGERSAMRVVTFMAHHQGMGIVALANVLLDGLPRKWGMGDARLQAVQSLLHEHAPREVSRLSDPPPAPTRQDRPAPELRRLVIPGEHALPPTHLLANGRYAVALRPNGAGWSRWDGIDVSRSRDDALRDAFGSFIYLRRSAGETPVSLTQHPAPSDEARYECHFHADRVCFFAHFEDLEARVTVWVSAEDDIELREVELRNLGELPLTLEVMSCFEVALSHSRADESHPAFANIFIRAQWDAQGNALYLERKPRLITEQGLHAVHFVADAERKTGPVLVQTDRTKWQGRNRERCTPLADFSRAPPTAEGDEVTGLEPVAALSVPVSVPARGKTRITFATAVARTRGDLEARVDQYLQPAHIERSSLMSSTLAAIRLREMDVRAENFAAIQALSTKLLSVTARRASLPVPTSPNAEPLCDRRALWRFGISGDRPIVLVHAGMAHGAGLLRALIQGLGVWAWSDVPCDVVVVNAEPASYLMPLQRELVSLRDRFISALDRALPGAHTASLHVLRADDLSHAESAALEMLARVRLNADGRPLAHHLEDMEAWHASAAEARAEHKAEVMEVTYSSVRPEPVEGSRSAGSSSFDKLRTNGGVIESTGHFDADSGEFRFEAGPSQRPQRPWVNVLANPGFGCQVSESGAGYTWARNSRLHQVTAWSNDPVSDAAGEWLLLQDVRTRKLWNVGASGLGGGNATVKVRHGQGYTVIAQRRGDVEIETRWMVDADLALKWVRLRLTNHGKRDMKLRAIGLAEWIMGANRSDRVSVTTTAVPLRHRDAPGEAPADVLFATQRDCHAGFGGSTAFMLFKPGVHDAADGWTCDRREFFDDDGRLVVPDRLGKRSGAGLDPCAGIARSFELNAGGTIEQTLLLGHADSPAAARALAQQVLTLDAKKRSDAVRDQWATLLGATRVQSPDPLFDAMANKWLLYQTVTCRIWARAGFYQAGGAFGYRDQLQDALSLALAAPQMLRQQILVSAARQFPEGDVQHWWHSPSGAGVRTHFSDDLLWLPYATAHYVEVTGDLSVLDDSVPFIEGRAVPPGHEDVYEVPQTSQQHATLYEHAARTIDHSLRLGVHGLPLMGTGDWNDGMNRVGHEGRGESVWLAMFLCRVVTDFSPIARGRGENERAQAWEDAARGWRRALRTEAWDGEWFKRAFFDDGSPLGSKVNDECRIDLIAQAWSVLGDVAPREMQLAALRSAEALLVDDANGVVRLLDPPLQKAEPSAGYIQAYPPGIRENGGQYSHAGVWALMAAARMGDPDLAWRIYQMLSPAHRAANKQLASAYAIEPYVMAGDIYTQPPYVGRGGWSWYTGSAAWMYRASIESICGLKVRNGGDVMLIPQLPPHWTHCTLTLTRQGRDHHFMLCRGSAAEALQAAEKRGAVNVMTGEWRALQAGVGPAWYLLMVEDAKPRELPRVEENSNSATLHQR